MAKKLVCFDWAMDKMLRHKANFDILEGFLSELLGGDVKIKQVLDSESNKETDVSIEKVVGIINEHKKYIKSRKRLFKIPHQVPSDWKTGHEVEPRASGDN